MSQSTAVLQAVLVDLVDLGLQGKQAHWNVGGPFFRSVHLELDEVVGQLLEWQDEVAERISALGGHPDGRAATVASGSTVAPLAGGPLRDVDVVTGFSDRLAAASAAISARFGEAEADLPSQDVLIGIVAGLDKAAWFFRAQVA
ncbi:MAG: DNA starvation/stationary phase protection protein [Propionibacteriaceae bacterium]|jgi:starvation-inducible DNA-binding protein|nr:DNA starvation/stationary phase protection protein [Propionibacteriaceae bacterium]